MATEIDCDAFLQLILITLVECFLVFLPVLAPIQEVGRSGIITPFHGIQTHGLQRPLDPQFQACGTFAYFVLCVCVVLIIMPFCIVCM